MKSVAFRLFCGSAVLLCLTIEGRGQHAGKDPRVGLKPGLRNAGQAAWNMELVTSLPKPDGFFDPSEPAGEPTGPETSTTTASTDTTNKPGAQPAPAAPARPPNGLNFANSDLAFSGSLVFVGNFNGFNTYDIESAKKPLLFTSVVCPGGQGDVPWWLR